MRVLPLLFAIFLAGVASADQPPLTGGEFAIKRSTIDTGGGASMGGEFVLRATIGQSDVGMSSGGAFALRGGFWSRRGILPEEIFRNGFETLAALF